MLCCVGVIPFELEHMNLSELLNEAVQHESNFVWSDNVVYVMSESNGWHAEAIRQVRAAAEEHTAYLKKKTGKGWKLFKHVMSDNSQLVFRFEPSRRQDITTDPMVVLRVAYMSGSDFYKIDVEVWSAGMKQATHLLNRVDVDLLDDPERFYFHLKDALAQITASQASTASQVESKSIERMTASQVKRGMMMRGGSPERPIYRRAARVERMDEDMSRVAITFDSEYVDKNGHAHIVATFPMDMLVSIVR